MLSISLEKKKWWKPAEAFFPETVILFFDIHPDPLPPTPARRPMDQLADRTFSRQAKILSTWYPYTVATVQ